MVQIFHQQCIGAEMQGLVRLISELKGDVTLSQNGAGGVGESSRDGLVRWQGQGGDAQGVHKVCIETSSGATSVN